MVAIRRDPFARTELHRELCDGTETKWCAWCGMPRMPRGKKLRLFSFETQHDGGRRERHQGLFCSTACHDSYHGG